MSEMQEEEIVSFSDVVRKEVMEIVNEREWWCHHCSTYMPVDPVIEVKEENGRKVATVKLYCVACDTLLDMFFKYV